MNMQKLSRISYLVALALVALAIATCNIPLRGGEEPAKMLGPDAKPADPLAAKLAECRSVTYEQKDALIECRKAWVEQRRQILGQDAQAPSDSRMPQAGPSLFVAPKDESRVRSGFPSIQQNEKE